MKEVTDDTITTAREAREKLGVNLVITGKLESSGDAATMAIDLVDAETLHPLKRSKISDPLANLSTWQDSLVMRLARMLDVKLPASAFSSLKAGYTAVPDAYGAYVRAHGYLYPSRIKRQPDSARTAFSRAIAYDSSFVLAYVGLGEIYWQEYWDNGAKDTLLLRRVIDCSKRAIDVSDQLPAAYTLLGVGEREIHRYDDAIHALRRAVEIDSNYFEAFDGMTRTYCMMGKYELALGAAKSALRARPKSYVIHDWMVTICRALGDYKTARKQARAMIRLRPDKARGYSDLGAIYCDVDSLPAAGAMLEKSLALQPRAYNVCSNLGTLYFWEARYADAAQMYEQAMALSDNSGKDYLILGHYAEALYWTPGRRDKAKAFFEAAVSLAEQKLKANPGNPGLSANLASYYSVLGDRAKSLTHLEQAISQNPSTPDDIFQVAQTYEYLGDRESALVWVEKALANGYPPGHLDRYPGLKDLRSDERFRRLRPQS